MCEVRCANTPCYLNENGRCAEPYCKDCGKGRTEVCEGYIPVDKS